VGVCRNSEREARAIADTKRCPSCGLELPANAGQSFCPACLLRQGMESEALNPSHHAEPGVTARSGEGISHRSVLEVLKSAIGEVPSVLLRDTRTGLESTVRRPSSPELREDERKAWQALWAGVDAVLETAHRE
jgi:uncharacterized Zn finger protein (UPF0148 family)